jgi:hypothetical protein
MLVQVFELLRRVSKYFTLVLALDGFVCSVSAPVVTYVAVKSYMGIVMT